VAGLVKALATSPGCLIGFDVAQLDLGDGGEQRLFGEGLGADLQARSVHAAGHRHRWSQADIRTLGRKALPLPERRREQSPRGRGL
jgi:hypothetical protein